MSTKWFIVLARCQRLPTVTHTEIRQGFDESLCSSASSDTFLMSMLLSESLVAFEAM